MPDLSQATPWNAFATARPINSWSADDAAPATPGPTDSAGSATAGPAHLGLNSPADLGPISPISPATASPAHLGPISPVSLDPIRPETAPAGYRTPPAAAERTTPAARPGRSTGGADAPQPAADAGAADPPPAADAGTADPAGCAGSGPAATTAREVSAVFAANPGVSTDPVATARDLSAAFTKPPVAGAEDVQQGGDRDKGRRGLFRRGRSRVGDAGPETEREEALAAQDEEYVDWVAGLGRPQADDEPTPKESRRSLRSTGRHHRD